jgi:hypothetical protein
LKKGLHVGLDVFSTHHPQDWKGSPENRRTILVEDNDGFVGFLVQLNKDARPAGLFHHEIPVDHAFCRVYLVLALKMLLKKVEQFVLGQTRIMMDFDFGHEFLLPLLLFVAASASGVNKKMSRKCLAIVTQSSFCSDRSGLGLQTTPLEKSQYRSAAFGPGRRIRPGYTPDIPDSTIIPLNSSG